jgi:hypothetical protein
MKGNGVPMLLFVVSAILSLTALPLALASFVFGAVLTVFALLRRKHNALTENAKGSSKLLLISGIVLMVAPIVTVLLTIAGMSGLFR